MAIDDLIIKPSDFAMRYCHAGAAEAGITPEEFATRLIEAIAHDDILAQENVEALAIGEALFMPHMQMVRDTLKDQKEAEN